MRRNPAIVFTAAVAVTALLSPAAANAATTASAPPATADAVAKKRSGGSDLGRNLETLTRNAAWKKTSTIDLGFDTFHPQGMVVTGDRIYLSSVEIIEPTVRYPSPVDGKDRTVGRGVGHLFVMDRTGRLLHDIRLGEGDSYHPGGIDTDGRNIWVSVAEYRPNSHAIVYRVDMRTLKGTKIFEADDHVGGIVYDRARKRLVGNTWGSRRFYEWDLRGREKRTWLNPSHFIDYQDCAYVGRSKAACTGVTNLPAQPGGKPYELGGIALIDLVTTKVLNEVPMQEWSRAGHVATRNPVHLAADGDSLTMYAAPDDSDEGDTTGKGTQILVYTATIG